MPLGHAETLEYLESFELFLESTIARQAWGDHVCLAKFIPTPNGSPETLVDDGVDEGAKVTGAWCDQLVKALEPAHTEIAILSVLARFESNGFRIEDFAKVASEKFMRGTLLGALDSQWERDNEEVLQPIHFALNPLPLNVTGGTYGEVLKHWDKQQVLTRPAFDALQEGTKRKAFTVARMTSSELLDTTHAELRRQIELGRTGGQTEGLALRDFHKFAAKRLESAGWTPASPSHVETIFRTNVISAYSSGRFTEMRQPAVLAALPYWQILAVKDPRTRDTHKAASGIVLPATDPFWKHAYPPFGYNCRCKVCARTKAWLERNAKSVGPTPHDLPDPGFDSGTKTLIQVPDAALKQAPADQPAPAPVEQPRPPGLGPASPFPNEAPPQTAPNFTPALLTPPPATPYAPGLSIPSPFLPKPAPPLPQPPTEQDFKNAGIELYAQIKPASKMAKKILDRELTPSLVHSLLGLKEAGVAADEPIAYRIETYGTDTLEFSAKFDGSQISREYKRENGELVVHHQYFKLTEEARASGIGKKILRAQALQYDKLGVERIETEAAWDGQYVWPRMGFTLRNPEKLDQLKLEFSQFLSEKYGLTPERATELASHAKSVHELAMTRVTASGVEQAGKDFLIGRGNSPRGQLIELQVRKGQPEESVFRSYLGLPARGH